jgi:hypothetical protein
MIEDKAEVPDNLFPEMASILKLDEQNLLEIAPREDAFLINMEHERNASADWDLMETENYGNTKTISPKSVESRDFAIVAETEEPKAENSFEENSRAANEEEITTQPEQHESKSAEETEPEENTVQDRTENGNEEKIEIPSEELVEESKNEEQNEPEEANENDVAEDGEDDSTIAEESESVGIPPVSEEDESIKSDVQSTKNVVSVPNFIASTVVSEVAKEKLEVSEELIEVIVNRVMERLSDNVVREIAWEIVPSHTDVIVKKMVQEKLDKD